MKTEMNRIMLFEKSEWVESEGVVRSGWSSGRGQRWVESRGPTSSGGFLKVSFCLPEHQLHARPGIFQTVVTSL